MPLQLLAFISGKSNPRTWKRSVREVAAADGRDMQPKVSGDLNTVSDSILR